MAEDVNITSSDLPGWATETTLEKISNAVEKLAGLSDAQKKEMKKGFNDMKQTGKANAKNVKAAGKGGSDNIFNDATRGLGKFADEANKGQLSLESLQDPLDDFEKGLSSSAKRMGLIGGAFAMLGAQVGLAISDIKDTVGALRTMTDVGIQVKGGFDGLRDTMAHTGMSLDEVTGITDKYTRTVGNVGLRSILDLAKGAEDGSFAFREYGLLVSEGAEFQAKMLESQRLGGIFRVRDERAQQMALQDNIKNLTAYSNILNVSREEMASAQVEAKSRADVQAKFNALDEKSRLRANKNFDDFTAVTAAMGEGGKQMQELMIDIISSPVAEASDAFTAIAAVSPAAGQAIKQLQSDIMNTDEIDPMALVDQLTDIVDKTTSSGQFEMLRLGDETKEVATMMAGPLTNSLRNFRENLERAKGDTIDDKLKSLGESTDGSVSAAMGLDQELRNLSESIKSSRIDIFMRMFGDEAAAGVETITGAVAGMAETVDWLGDASWEDIGKRIVETFNNVVWPAVSGLFAKASDWLSLKIEDAFLWIADIPVRIGNAIANSPIGDLLGMEVSQLPSEAKAMVEGEYGKGPKTTGNVDLDTAVRAQVYRHARAAAGPTGAATAAGLSEYEKLRAKQSDELKAAMDRLYRSIAGPNGLANAN